MSANNFIAGSADNKPLPSSRTVCGHQCSGRRKGAPQGRNALVLSFLGALLCAALFFPLSASAQTSQEELKKALRQVLKENPELVMDVLKDNSETVLDIAQQGNIIRKRKALRAQWEEDVKQPKKVDLKDRAFLGKAAAPVTVVAYSDFTCPYCRQAEHALNQLMEKHSGKLRYTFKALPKDEPASISLAKISTAAFMMDEEKGWKLYEALFQNVEKFEREGEAFLKETSASAGFDYKKLKAEAAGAAVEARLAADRKEADGLGITGTPYFLVNDILIRGAVSRDLFEEAIEMALGAASK